VLPQHPHDMGITSKKKQMGGILINFSENIISARNPAVWSGTERSERSTLIILARLLERATASGQKAEGKIYKIPNQRSVAW